jgi:hypothetical protein
LGECFEITNDGNDERRPDRLLSEVSGANDPGLIDHPFMHSHSHGPILSQRSHMTGTLPSIAQGIVARSMTLMESVCGMTSRELEKLSHELIRVCTAQAIRMPSLKARALTPWKCFVRHFAATVTIASVDDAHRQPAREQLGKLLLEKRCRDGDRSQTSRRSLRTMDEASPPVMTRGLRNQTRIRKLSHLRSMT